MKEAHLINTHKCVYVYAAVTGGGNGRRTNGEVKKVRTRPHQLGHSIQFGKCQNGCFMMKRDILSLSLHPPARERHRAFDGLDLRAGNGVVAVWRTQATNRAARVPDSALPGVDGFGAGPGVFACRVHFSFLLQLSRAI